MKLSEVDFGLLDDMWVERARRVAAVRRRADPSGMTRPARDGAERTWLEGRSGEGPFVEVKPRRKRPRPRDD